MPTVVLYEVVVSSKRGMIQNGLYQLFIKEFMDKEKMNLKERIEEFKAEVDLWQQSYNNHADGYNTTALHDLKKALEIIEELQKEIGFLKGYQHHFLGTPEQIEKWKSESATLANILDSDIFEQGKKLQEENEKLINENHIIRTCMGDYKEQVKYFTQINIKAKEENEKLKATKEQYDHPLYLYEEGRNDEIEKLKAKLEIAKNYIKFDIKYASRKYIKESAEKVMSQLTSE